MKRALIRYDEAWRMIGLTFISIGPILIAMQFVFWLLTGDDTANGRLMESIVLGCSFTVLGFLILRREERKRINAEKLLAGGHYIWGEIVDVERNLLLRSSFRGIYYARVRFFDKTRGVWIV